MYAAIATTEVANLRDSTGEPIDASPIIFDSHLGTKMLQM
jgi:hypothetical protein